MLLPEHTCYDRYSLSSKYYEPHAFYRKHFWCFSTFRTKNIHIYLVCCCQSTLATIDIPFPASITNRTRFIENISGVFPRLERRICTYILSVAASALLLRSIFLFEPVLRAVRAFYRKHFWCFSTFRTKNTHIYLVCFTYIMFSSVRITNRTRLYFKVVYWWLNEMHELRIERSVNTHRLLRVSVKSP